MGNVLNTAIMDSDNLVLVDAILPYDNLSISEIEAYWRSFYDHASSFALTRNQFQVVCSHASCMIDRHASTKKSIENADKVFDVFVYHHSSSSNNKPESASVIDALEFLSVVVFISEISLEDKIDLLFDSWEMSEDGAIDIDEFTISLKSTLCGLIKVLKENGGKIHSLPTDEEIEKLADEKFRQIAKVHSHSASLDHLQITCEQFRNYCLQNDKARGLFEMFNNTESENNNQFEDNEAKMIEEMLLEKNQKDIIQKNGSTSTAVAFAVSTTTNNYLSDLKISALSTVAPTNPFENLEEESGGDEFLAIKPWKGGIVPPSKVPPMNQSAPLVNVKLDYIFGYSAQESKNNLRYCVHNTNKHEIVYPAAAACVVLNPKTNVQRHFLSHTDDVLCLTIHPTTSIVASGEIGKNPKVFIWNSNTMDTLCTLQGFHKRGILALAFDNVKGNLLVTIGGDEDHSLAIYETKDEWQTATLKWSSKGNKAIPMHVAFPNPTHQNAINSFVCVGAKSIDFWFLENGENNNNKKTITSKKAILGKKGNFLQNFLVAEYSSDGKCLVGTTDGEIYVFNGTELQTSIKAHPSSVTSLFTTSSNVKGNKQQIIISGGKDGQICIWNDGTSLKQPQMNIFLSELAPQTRNVSIRSCCISEDMQKLLIGTQSSEIFEIELKGTQTSSSVINCLMKGHYHQELWGLDIHPRLPQCCTVGDDRTLRIWDLATKRELRSVTLHAPARTCAYSHDGKLIAIGYGTGTEEKKTGTGVGIGANTGFGKGKKGNQNLSQGPSVGYGFSIFHEADLSKLKDGTKDAKKWISDIKFSPDDKLLAFGSHDTNIYVYDVLKGFTKKQIFKKHTASITHFDFSSDGNHLQSTCGGYELLYSEAKTGKHHTNGGTLFRDEKWHSMTCPLGWAVQGIWPEGSDGTDINSIARSRDSTLLATGDDFGKVKLFRYPCALEKASAQELKGHASHVTNVRWSFSDHFLVSTGGNDRCVFLWRHSKPNEKLCISSSLTTTSHSKSNMTNSLELEAIAREEDDPAVSVDDAFDSEIDGGGDEFMAVKPWLGAIVPPTNAEPSDGSSPNAQLQLERVHGYQAKNASNNARYDNKGNIVYHAAALGIVSCSVAGDQLGTFEQRFNMDHDDDIIALGAHPNGEIFATAQMGKNPKIYVWKSTSTNQQAFVCLEGFHKRFVSCLTFSFDGKKIGSIGGDDDHSIAIYHWEKKTLVASAKGERNQVNSICYHEATNEWVTCGDKHVRFWKEQGRNLTCKKGTFGKANGIQSFDVVISFMKHVIVGTSNGDLYLFHGTEVNSIVKAHSSNVYALHAHGETLVSGSKDGSICVWDFKINRPIHKFELQKTWAATYGGTSDIHPNQIGLLNPSIRSVCIHPHHASILLIGTSGSDLLEVDLDSKQQNSNGSIKSIVTRGHSTLELWGLCCHPNYKEYVTVGDDQTLRVWSLESKKQMFALKLECMARTCCFSNKGDLLAIGLGGRTGKKISHTSSTFITNKSGSFLLFKYDENLKKKCTLFYEDKPSKQWISEIKFSPNGQRLAIGSHDNCIYLYEILFSSMSSEKKVRKFGIFDKHHSYITHFDFSKNNFFLQSTCGGYELLFCNVQTKNCPQMTCTSNNIIKDIEWDTWTCTLGWPVQGIWPAFSDGTDINAVDRSKNKKLIVTADDFGKVNLYRYPCVQKKASANEYRGHASHVMNARWTVNDEYVVTVGGNDRCIMEWKLIDPMVDANTQKKNNLASREKEKEKKQEQEQLQEQEVGQENDIPEEIEEETIIVPRSSNAASFEVIMKEENGDEFMAIRPWIGAIVSPTNVPIPNAKEPDLKLQLEWIYGYQSEFSKENLRYNAKGEIIYHTAAVGIIYEKKYHLQKFHFGHSDDISCLAISNNGELIATGEKGKRPCIRIWDAHTGAFKSELKHFHTRGIHCLNFDEQNQRLVSIGEDDDHSIALWEDPSGGNTWNNTGKLVASSKGEKNQSKFALIQTKTNNQQQEILIYTGGIKHFNVSRIQGKILTNKKGKFGKKGTIQDLPCGVIFSTSTNNPSKDQNQSVVVTGTASGELYIWQGDALIKAIKAHDPNTAVNALYVHEKQQILLSGGKDGKILIWNRQLIQIQMLNLTNEMILNKSIQSVCMSENGKIVLVGTASSDIVELDATNGTIIDGKPLFSGHFQHELWGLSVHPNCHSFTTTGDDRTLRVWDMETRQMHAITKLANKARACAYSPDGNLLGIGLGGDIGTRMAGKKNPKEGAIAILEMKSLKQVFEDRPAKEWISDVKFSPDGKTIAFGSHDNGIHLYTVENQGTSYKKRKPFHKHNSYITHLDFSKDSKYLQSNCGAYEYLFCDVATSEQIKSASSVKDVQWSTWTCPLGWPVQGIWPECADGTDINAVCASTSRTILATGDDSGKVKIFRYPCVMKGSKFIEGRGHSSHVTNVRFSFDDKYLISVGGNDRSIFQWKLS